MTPSNAAPCSMEALRKKIAERAYVLWESEGRPNGRDLDNWHQAESEVLAGCTTESEAHTQDVTAIRSIRTTVQMVSERPSQPTASYFPAQKSGV